LEQLPPNELVDLSARTSVAIIADINPRKATELLRTNSAEVGLTALPDAVRENRRLSHGKRFRLGFATSNQEDTPSSTFGNSITTLVAGAGYLAAGRGKQGQFVFGEGDAEGGDVLLEPPDALGAWDGDHRNAKPLLLGVHPGEDGTIAFIMDGPPGGTGTVESITTADNQYQYHVGFGVGITSVAITIVP
jgi:hypothetical protein